MKKYATALVLLLLVGLVAAEEIGQQRAGIKPEITRIGVLGKGIAISTADPLDFKMVKIGLIEVRVELDNKTITAERGLLWLDENKYQLRNASISNSSVAADVYLNDSYIGSLTLALVPRNDTDVWAGKLAMDGKEYNVYILEGKRGFLKHEFKQKVKEACKEGDEDCRQIAKGIGNRFCEKVEDPSCREKIAEFCEQNPDDQRCQAIMMSYCSNNTDDLRCRGIIKEVCKRFPNDERCWKYCRENPEMCRLQIKQEVKERIRERLEEARERMRNRTMEVRGKR
jgi:hypothetical protein